MTHNKAWHVTDESSIDTRSVASGGGAVAVIEADAFRFVIKYFSLYSVYVQCKSFAKLTFFRTHSATLTTKGDRRRS
jgi:hypothetical protein